MVAVLVGFLAVLIMSTVLMAVLCSRRRRRAAQTHHHQQQQSSIPSSAYLHHTQQQQQQESNITPYRGQHFFGGQNKAYDNAASKLRYQPYGEGNDLPSYKTTVSSHRSARKSSCCCCYAARKRPPPPSSAANKSRDREVRSRANDYLAAGGHRHFVSTTPSDSMRSSDYSYTDRSDADSYYNDRRPSYGDSYYSDRRHRSTDRLDLTFNSQQRQGRRMVSMTCIQLR